MREILFRGKRIDNGEWVEGFYNAFNHPRAGYLEHFIQMVATDGRIDTIYKIYPKTIGQYTGLADKNGKKVFEGDIVRLYGGEEYEWVARVEMKRGCLVVLSKDEWDFLETNTKVCEIIGNIHDNPELLKGAD